MKGPPLGLGGEDITWPDQVAPRGRTAPSTRKIKPQTSNLIQTRPPLILSKLLRLTRNPFYHSFDALSTVSKVTRAITLAPP